MLCQTKPPIQNIQQRYSKSKLQDNSQYVADSDGTKHTHFKQKQTRAGTNSQKDMQLHKSKERYLYFRWEMYSERNSVPSYLEESDTNNIDTFTGLTADPFKSRYNNHTKSFRHKKIYQ